MKKWRFLIILFCSILCIGFGWMQVYADAFNGKASNPKIGRVDCNQTLYNAYPNGMENPQVVGPLQHENIFKFSIDGKVVYCIQPNMQFYSDVTYTRKLTGEQAQAELRKNYVGMGYNDAKIQQLAQIASVGYGMNGDTSNEMYMATQIMLWRVKFPNEYTNIPANVQAKIDLIQQRLKVFTTSISWNQQTVTLKGYGQEHALRIPDTNGIFSQYTLDSLPNGLHVERENNDLIVWAEKGYTSQPLSFYALYKDGNSDMSVYASDYNQALAYFGKVPTPSAQLMVNIQTNPTMDSVQAQKSKEVSLKTHLKIKKTDGLSKKPISDIEFTIYRDGTALGTKKTNEKGEIDFDDIYDQTIQSELYRQEYCSNYADLIPEVQKTITGFHSQQEAQAFVDQKVDEDLKQKEKALYAQAHRYKVVETKTKQEYYLDPSQNTYAKEGKNGESLVFEITNMPIYGKIQIEKKGDGLTGVQTNSDKTISAFVYSSTSLEKAEFDIIAKEDIMDPSDGKVVYKAGSVVQHLVSKADQPVVSKPLYLGVYTIKETKVPDGFVDTNWQKDVQIGADANEKGIILDQESILNQRQKLVIQLDKKSATDNRPLAGAKFGLYANANIVNVKGDVLVSKGSLIQTATSDAKGKVNFSLDLPISKYSIRELEAPKGYIRNDTPIVLDIPKDSKQATITVQKTITNMHQPSIVPTGVNTHVFAYIGLLVVTSIVFIGARKGSKRGR